MRVITAPETYTLTDNDITVFLAGGITNCPDWQSDVIKRLENMGMNRLIVFNPRRENFPINDPSAADEQIAWEFNALQRADIFSMYFSAGDSDQPICMYELGRNIVTMQMKHPTDWQNRLIISVEDEYRRHKDVLVQTELACGGCFVNTTTDLLSSKESILRDFHATSILKSYLKLT